MDRRRQALSSFLALQILAPLVFAILLAAGPAASAPVETQDPITEVITSRIVFDGTEGSLYNATVAGAGGLTLGLESRTTTVGYGAWGLATYVNTTGRYPGSVYLSLGGAAQAVYFPNASSVTRYRAVGTTQWTSPAGPRAQVETAAFDFDGDGFLDDVAVANDLRTVVLYNQAGASQGNSNVGTSIANAINDLQAVDLSGVGYLGQVLIAHEAGRMYLYSSTMSFIWRYDVPSANSVSALAAADFDGDGLLEDAVGATDAGEVYAVRGMTNPPSLSWSYAAGSPAVGVFGYDVLGGGRLRGVLLGTTDAVVALNSTGAVVWNHPVSNATITALAPLDMDGDGRSMDVGVGLSNGTLLLLDANGSLTASFGAFGSAVVGIAPIDLDADGRRDEFVSANSTQVIGASAFVGADWTTPMASPINAIGAVDLDGWGCTCDTGVAMNSSAAVLARNGTMRWSRAHATPVFSVSPAANPSVSASGSFITEPIDATSDAAWTNLSVYFALPNANTALDSSVRFGTGTPSNISWGSWGPPSTAALLDLSGNSSRFLQVRVSMNSTDGISTPRLNGLRLNYTVPAASGSAVTAAVAPSGAHQFLTLDALSNTTGGGAVRLLYSVNGGTVWTPFTPGSSVDPANASAPSITFRVELDVGAQSPSVALVAVSYVHTALTPALVSPPSNSTITGTVVVGVAADPAIVAVAIEWFDPANNTTTPVGSAAWNATSLRWEAAWNTTGIDATGLQVVARATDGRGFSFAARVVGIRVDNTPPTVQVPYPTVGSNVTGVIAVDALTDLDVVSVSVSYFDGIAWQLLGNAVEVMPGAWSFVWNTTALGTVDGGRLSVTATDSAGLLGTFEVTPVTVDNDAPWVRIDSPVAGSTLRGVVQVNLTAAPDATRVSVQLNNGSAFPAGVTGRFATHSTWTVNLPTGAIMLDAAASLAATVWDRMNFSGANTSSPYSVDNTQMDAILLTPLPQTYNTGTVIISASAPAQTVRLAFYYQDAGAALPTFIRQLEATDQNSTTGLWEFNWDTRSPTQVDFNGSIRMLATPAFNGTPRWSNSSSWIVVDNTAPFVRFIWPTVSDKRLSGVATVRADASDDVAAIQLSYENQSSGQSFVVGQMTRGSGSEWSYAWDLTGIFVPSATLKLDAVDKVGFTASADVISDAVLGLVPGDDPPVFLRPASDISLEEDFGTYAMNLSGLITDEDIANLTAYLDGAPTSLVTLLNNGSKGLAPIYLLAVPNAHSGAGPSTLRLRVVDRAGQSASDDVQLFVAPVNDPPRWVDPPSRVFVRHGVPYELDFTQYIRDAEFESGEQTVTVSANDTVHIITNATRTQSLIFSYPDSMANETVNVLVSLQDSYPGALPVLHALGVTITADWVPELIRPIPTIELVEDTPRINIFNLNDYFTDRDNDHLFYYNYTGNMTLRRDLDGNVSVVAMPPDWHGTQTVLFGARDSQGAFTETRVAIVVRAVNDAPRWAFADRLDFFNYSVHFDLEYPLPLGDFVYDVDNPASELTANTSDPANAYTLPSGGLLLLLNFPEALNGTTQVITVRVFDGNDTSEPITLNVRVTDNYPPSIVQPFPQEIVLTEGEIRTAAIVLRDYFQDRDGVIYFAYGAHNITIPPIDNVTGHVTLIAPGEWSGSERIVFRAVDDDGAFQDAVVLVTVLSVDDPPRLAYIPDFEFEAGRFYNHSLLQYASDPDTPMSFLVFSATSSYPNALVFIAGDLLQVIYPASEGAPAFDALRVCVTDGGPQPACRTIAVKIRQATVQEFDWLRFFFFMGAVGVSSIIAARHFFEFKVRRPATVEDVFLVYEDGILIKHYSKQVRKFADDDVVTSMLSAIQSFAADSFEDTSNWELREIAFQGRKILIERARKFQIFVIFDGDSNEDLKREVRKAAESIAKAFAEPLKDWDGDPSHFDTAREHFGKLLAMQQAFVPEGVTSDDMVRAPLQPGAVFVSEAGDFSPILTEYASELEGAAVIRVRPQGDAGVALAGFKPAETILIEIPPPSGVPGDDEVPENGLDIVLGALNEALEEAEVTVRNRPPVVLFEGFEFVVDRYGFVFSKKFSDQLKRIAKGAGFCLLVAVNPAGLTSSQLEALERDATVFRTKR